MRLKSYFAGTVEEALNQAHQELGPDAMLVDSRRAGKEASHLGEYEVICASVLPSAPADGEAAENDLPATSSRAAFRAPGLDRLSQEVAGLKRSMERMAATIAQSSAGLANIRSSPELAEAFALLIGAEVEPALAHEVVAGIAERLPGAADPAALLGAELEQLLRADATLGRPGARQKIVALVGPPGGGKTATLVKLAARYGLATRRPTHILSVDTFRVGASEQLRSYAGILGLGFQFVDTVSGLAQALEECKSKELLFLDTPGFGKRDMAEGAALAQFLSANPDVDTHLVLPVSLKAADLRRIIEQYEIFHPAKLVFSRMDETGTFGSILNAIVRTGKPVSFLCSGQQIPEDLTAAKKDDLAGLILRTETIVNPNVAAA